MEVTAWNSELILEININTKTLYKVWRIEYPTCMHKSGLEINIIKRSVNFAMILIRYPHSMNDTKQDIKA